MPLDVCGYFSPKVPFDPMALLEDLADLHHFVIRKLVAIRIKGHAGLNEDFSRTRPTDSVDIGERHLHPLILR